MKLSKLLKLRRELNKISYKCKDGCFECCGAIKFTPLEKKLMDKELRKNGYNNPPSGKGNKLCEYLDKEGKCSVYKERPIICRLFGNLKLKIKGFLLPSCSYAKNLYSIEGKELEEYLKEGREGIRNQCVEKGLKEFEIPLLSNQSIKELKEIFNKV